MDRFAQFAFVAAEQAVADSKLEITDANRDTIGVIMGSGIGGILTLEQQHRVLLEQGPGRLSPFFIPMLIGNIAPGLISIALNVHGPTQTTVSACASSNNAIGDAFRAIQYGEADAMICGGSEAPITPLAVGGFCAMRALSTRNDDPRHASRPFDTDRDGFVIGEGGGALVLEELESAKSATRESMPSSSATASLRMPITWSRPIRTPAASSSPCSALCAMPNSSRTTSTTSTRTPPRPVSAMRPKRRRVHEVFGERAKACR